MTHPLVAAISHEIAADVESRVRHGAVTESSEPEATAVVRVFLAKLLGVSPEAQAVPLDELVTPASLPGWRDLFQDASRLAPVRQRYGFFNVFQPWVQPQEDGTVRVGLVWMHPDQTEPRPTVGGEQFLAYWAYTEYVGEPAGWRVRNLS